MLSFISDLTSRFSFFGAGSGTSDTISDMLLKDPNIAILKEGVDDIARMFGISAIVDAYAPYVFTALFILMVLGVTSNQQANAQKPADSDSKIKNPDPPKT